MNVTEHQVVQLAAAFQEAGVRFRREEPLARYTTVGLGGPAELLAFPASTKETLAAVRLANENCYGLASGVWTQNPARAHRK